MEDITPEELQQFLQILKQSGYTEEQLASFGPEQLKAMYADYAGQESLIENQRAQAEALRGATSAGLGGTSAGRVFMADNPLETLAQVGGQFAGAKADRRLNEEAKALSDMKGSGQMDMARLFAMGGGDPRAAAMRGMTPEALAEEERRRRLGVRTT